MRRIAKLLSFVPVALVFAACDSADQMTAPQSQARTVASASAVAAPAATGGMIKVDGPLAAGRSNRVMATGTNNIGAEGGIVQVWGAGRQIAQLGVPAGAVDKGTLFSVKLTMVNGQLGATVTAEANGKEVTSFNTPLKLYYNTINANVFKTSGPSFGIRAAAQGQASTSDPNSPPPGDGWVWVSIDGFTGWIIIV